MKLIWHKKSRSRHTLLNNNKYYVPRFDLCSAKGQFSVRESLWSLERRQLPVLDKTETGFLCRISYNLTEGRRHIYLEYMLQEFSKLIQKDEEQEEKRREIGRDQKYLKQSICLSSLNFMLVKNDSNMVGRYQKGLHSYSLHSVYCFLIQVLTPCQKVVLFVAESL